MQVGAQSGPALRVEVHVPVDDQQVQFGGGRQHGADGRELAQVEQPGPVRRDSGQPDGALLDEGGEPVVVGNDESAARRTLVRVVHIHGPEPLPLRTDHYESLFGWPGSDFA